MVGLAAVSTARLLLRHHSIDMLYGEDGSVFLPAALRDGLAPVATPYQGYLHVVPRLLAFVVAQFPIEHAALAFTVAASLVTALVAVFVFFAAASWIDSAVTRGMLAAAMVLDHRTPVRSLAFHRFRRSSSFRIVSVIRASHGGQYRCVTRRRGVSTPQAAHFMTRPPHCFWIASARPGS